VKVASPPAPRPPPVIAQRKGPDPEWSPDPLCASVSLCPSVLCVLYISFKAFTIFCRLSFASPKSMRLLSL
jgi:hypothetical protein